ncbi:FecR family protein [Novosphingobium sp. CF614]|uniref:FecR family protein n=1 Tax=Novosphingobium sp. CF614 TaxID=1884364 RepID=UPI0008F063AE|nr:FecR family protein [Novosphingobium sp. CF614]SFG34484.1 FecR family protein [Novosphingobium sp. CF614]
MPKEIRDAASHWVAMRDAGTMTARDECDLATWLAADPLHARAFAEAEAFWGTMSGAQVKAALHDRYGRTTVPRGLRPGAWLSSQWARPALAASLVLILVGSAQDWPTRIRADAVTETGERRDVSLDDGSMVQLNTGSAIAIDYTGNRRVIRLLKGEAAFTVAPDRTRPFTVRSGEGSTTALGTRFIVRHDDESTNVTVTEHRVRVAWPTPYMATLDLDEGQATRYGPGGIEPAHRVDASAATAWTRGVLVFVDRPLGEVVAELNRYHPGIIRVIGADLAARRVSGGFRTDDPVGAIGTLQHTLGIRSTRITNRLIFLHS